MNSSDLSFVIQGPLFRTSGAGDLALKCTNSIRKFFPDSEIILSTWQDQDAGGLPVDQIVRNEDPGGFEDLNGEKLNVNRQILSTRKGLEVATRRYAVKFRADFALAGTSFFAREVVSVVLSGKVSSRAAMSSVLSGTRVVSAQFFDSVSR